ncbi:ABC transporter substrate-binding protein [Paenibacillus cymbidii]|uniref:ABC transporter substrate-binding protein n=1 Tax=Paenibacillus cymbidii TaxID=1639034 RepID=UPI001436C6CB|nr:sugar ABC transporter substrate-binding protein [Paenibacillus cymbidii]
MKKRMMIAATALTLVASIAAGCGSGTGKDSAGTASPAGSPKASSSAKPSGADKQITIEFWGGPQVLNVEGIKSTEYGDYEKAMIASFEEKNPGIKVKYKLIGAAEIEQAITVALTGNNQPDVILDALGKRLIKYVNSGKVEDISDFYDPSKFNKSMIDAVTINGKIYGVPLWDHPEIVFLNKTIFKNKGLENLIPASRDWTIDQMRDVLKQVSGGGVYGTAFYALNEQGDEMMQQRFYNMGGKMWNDEQTEIVMDKYPEAAEWIQTMIDMMKEGSAAPGAATTQAVDALEMFKQGKLAMLPWGTGMYGAIAAGKKDGSIKADIELYGIKPPHKAGAELRLTNVGAAGISVFKQTDKDKREAVKKFVQFMTTPASIKAMAKAGGYLPAHNEAAYEPDDADLRVIMKEIANIPMASLGYKSKAYAGVRPLWFPELQAAFAGGKTPKQAVADFTQKANNMIAQVNKN